MAIYNGPPRGGTRGGKDQFSWDNVKTDKFRENYLGHSVKALTGRWQKGKDVYWYTREKQEGGGPSMTELEAVKAREAELMAQVHPQHPADSKAYSTMSWYAQALGLKPKTAAPAGRGRPLEKHELAALLKKDDDDAGPSAGAGAGLFEEDRMKGLGFGRMVAAGSEPALEILAAEGVEAPGGAIPGPQGPPPGSTINLSAAELKLLQKAMKKNAKSEKKAKKKSKDKKKKKSKKSKAKDSSSDDDSRSLLDNRARHKYSPHGAADAGAQQGRKRVRHDSDDDREEPGPSAGAAAHSWDAGKYRQHTLRRYDSDDQKEAVQGLARDQSARHRRHAESDRSTYGKLSGSRDRTKN